jgi:ketosteroid isomerase-like protein
VVIAEVQAKATVTTTGRSLATTSIQILRIREGRIVLWRDFADPRVLEEITGGSTASAGTLPGQPRR